MASLGLTELGLHQFWGSRAPTMQQWRKLAPQVIAELKKGTRQSGASAVSPLVIVAPHWAEPLARTVLGSVWMPLAHVARPDESGFQSAVEISLVGARSLTPGWSQDWQKSLGPFELRGLSNSESVQILYEFVDHLRPPFASVSTVKKATKKESARDCAYGKHRVTNGDLHGHSTFPAQRFACGGGDWHFAGVTVIEDQLYRPRRCIWAHPSQGRSLRIEFAEVPIGRKLRGYSGLPYFHERQSHGTPVEMEVRVGEQLIGTVEHQDGEGWAPFEFSTRAWAGQRLKVEFRVRSRRVAHRQFCFQADVR